MGSGGIIHHLLLVHIRRRLLFSSSFCTTTRLLSSFNHSPSKCELADATLQVHNSHPLLSFFPKHLSHRLFSTSATDTNDHEHVSSEKGRFQHEITDDEETDGQEEEEEGEAKVHYVGLDDDEETDGWEEEEEVEAKPGDGGDGGGIVLQGVAWGEQVLSIAREVLSQFANDLELYAFKTTHRGYVYVRLDKLSNKYGCPSMEELESYCQEYKKRLEEVGALGEIPDNLAVEVSSPGAERILKVPGELSRFKDMPMRVTYLEGAEPSGKVKDGIFVLESIDVPMESCVWKLADVKENRDPESKGRPMSRKRRDWRISVHYSLHTRVTLYLEF